MSSNLSRWVYSAAELETRLAENNGELSQSLEEWISFMDVQLPGAVDHAKLLLERMETIEKEWRARAAEVTRVARGIENAKDRIKDRIKKAMIETGQKELKGDAYRLALVISKPALKLDAAQVPNEYKTPIVEMVPDKDKIRSAIEGGESVMGAELVESFALRSYPNKLDRKE